MSWPVASFGLVLVGAAVSYQVLERALIAAESEESRMRKALGRRTKEWLSTAGYLSAIILAFVSPLVSVAIYVVVAFLWLVPDRRFARA
jgi:uncharacterized membrane protein